MIVPSFRLLTSNPLTAQVVPVTVAVTGAVVVVPSVAVTVTVAAASTVPLSVVSVSLDKLMGVVTE